MSIPLEEMAGSQGRVSAGASTLCPDDKDREKEREIREETDKDKSAERLPLDEPLEVSWQAPTMTSMADSPDYATNEAQSALPSQSLIGWRLVVVETCLCLGLLLSIVDASIVATALVPIEDYFDNFFESIWIVLAYLLSYMAFSLLWARLSDVLGRKWMVVASWCIFTAFSLGCGLASSLPQLIVFRALQGIGGSGLYSLCNVVVPEITPKEHFATMSAATGVVFAVSSVLGPVLGGVISQNSTWRWIFLLNVPCGVVALAVVLLTWPNPKPPPGYTKSTMFLALLGHVDFIGALLLLIATTLLIFAMEEGGAGEYAWNSAAIIATFSASGVCFLGLAAWITLLTKKGSTILITPIIPIRILKHRILAAAILTALLTGFPLFLTIIVIPERYQIVNDASPTTAGIRLMPLLFASAFGSTVGGILSSRKNRTFITLTIASCLMVIGCALLSTAADTVYVEPALYGFQFIFGLGIGITFTTVTIIASTESKFADYSVALGMVNQARIFGGVVGLASSTIILNIRIARDLQDVLSPSQLSSLRQSLSYIPELDLEQQLAVVSTFALSFNDQLRYCTYVAAVCAVIGLFTFSRHPTDILKRKERGVALLAGRMTLAEADA